MFYVHRAGADNHPIGAGTPCFWADEAVKIASDLKKQTGHNYLVIEQKIIHSTESFEETYKRQVP